MQRATSAKKDRRAAREVAKGEKFYFHTSNKAGSSNRQVVARITSMAADESGCPAADGGGDSAGAGGVPVGWVIVIALMSSGALFAVIFFVYLLRIILGPSFF